MIYLYILIISFISSLIFVRLSINAKWKTKKSGAPSISCAGGLGIYAAFLIAIIVAVFLRHIYGLKLIGLIISSGMILVLGFIDDLYDLLPSIKIIGTILGIIALILFGFVTKIMFLPVWLNIVITALWLLFITNALNLLDIMDGLASGLTLIISLTLLVVSLVNRDIFSSSVLIALIGAHSGFLRYNYPPARVYMGDAGSLFSGFLLAAIAINISYAPSDRPVALITPILVLSFPIYDTLFLIAMRVKKSRPIFKKTKDHFALRLVIMGNSVRKSVLIMYSFSAFLALGALVVAFGSNITGLGMLAVIILVFILLGRIVAMVDVS